MSQDSSASAAKTMKAMRLPQFGGGDQFRLEEIDRPSPGRGEVLVRIAGTSVNPVDAKARAGELPQMFPASACRCCSASTPAAVSRRWARA